MNAWLSLEAGRSGQLLVVLGHFIWQGALIGLAAFAGAFLLRKSRPELRYGMYVTALAGIALCVPITFLLVGEPTRAGENPPAASGALSGEGRRP